MRELFSILIKYCNLLNTNNISLITFVALVVYVRDQKTISEFWGVLNQIPNWVEPEYCIVRTSYLSSFPFSNFYTSVLQESPTTQPCIISFSTLENLDILLNTNISLITYATKNQFFT